MTVPPPPTVAQKSSIVGPVVGGVVGGLGLIALAVLAFFFWRRRQRARASESTAKLYEIDEMETQFEPTPNPAIALYSLPADHSTSRDHLDPERRQSHDAYLSPVPMTSAGDSQPRLTKAQEAARHRYQPSGYTLATSDTTSSAPHSNPASNSGSSGQEPPSVVSPSEVQGLRTEVENLRRAMDEMQMERIEAPPSYTPQQ